MYEGKKMPQRITRLIKRYDSKATACTAHNKIDRRRRTIGSRKGASGDLDPPRRRVRPRVFHDRGHIRESRDNREVLLSSAFPSSYSETISSSPWSLLTSEDTRRRSWRSSRSRVEAIVGHGGGYCGAKALVGRYDSKYQAQGMYVKERTQQNAATASRRHVRESERWA